MPYAQRDDEEKPYQYYYKTSLFAIMEIIKIRDSIMGRIGRQGMVTVVLE